LFLVQNLFIHFIELFQALDFTARKRGGKNKGCKGGSPASSHKKRRTGEVESAALAPAPLAAEEEPMEVDDHPAAVAPEPMEVVVEPPKRAAPKRKKKAAVEPLVVRRSSRAGVQESREKIKFWTSYNWREGGNYEQKEEKKAKEAEEKKAKEAEEAAEAKAAEAKAAREEKKRKAEVKKREQKRKMEEKKRGRRAKKVSTLPKS